MSSNEKERNSHSRGHGPMRVSEKPKDFIGSIKKLMEISAHGRKKIL